MSPSPLFDPKDFLRLARGLAQQNGAREAELRTAVSRAYYGVFLQAREMLASSGEITPTGTGRDHELVIEALRNRGGPHGDELDKLRRNRNRVDYNLMARVTRREARQALMTAEFVCNRL